MRQRILLGCMYVCIGRAVYRNFAKEGKFGVWEKEGGGGGGGGGGGDGSSIV